MRDASLYCMGQRNGTRKSREDTTGPVGRSAASVRALLTGAEQFAQGVSFWSAIVLPFVAVALLVLQPTGWMPALVAVLAVDVGALLVGHCHGREC